ncbi:MAG: hypothetical protein IJ214_01330 [Clostridia bacterium]|nr:hypothetical protein [Clostridia bacterium]
MRILIVRHADPDYAHDSITEKGRRETNLLAARLSAILAYLTNMSPVLMLWHGFLLPTSSFTALITPERTRGEIEFRCISAGDIIHLLQGNEQCSLRGLFPQTCNGAESTDPSIRPYTSPIPVTR